MSDRLKAIVAHVTIVGWVIALIINLVQSKTPLTIFYLRQMLGLLILSFIAGLLPSFIGNIVALLVFGLWIYSLVGAIKNERWELPLIGEYFQKWFNFI